MKHIRIEDSLWIKLGTSFHDNFIMTVLDQRFHRKNTHNLIMISLISEGKKYAKKGENKVQNKLASPEYVFH